jgi:hypothetical protein
VTWVLEYPLTWLLHGKRVPGRIAIGTPGLTPDRDDGEAICPVALDGLQPGVTQVHGVDTLQAMLLALCYIGRRLRDSAADGVRVVLPDDDDPESATRHLLWLFEMVKAPDRGPLPDSEPEPDLDPDPPG